MSAELDFEEVTHTYRFNGAVVPSVTQVIKALYAFEGIPAAVLKAKGELGTVVHKLCEYDWQGILDEETVDPKAAPYLAAWRQFLVDKKPTILLNERRFHHPARGYAGQIDWLMQFDDLTWLIDTKTSVSVGPQVGVQLAGYEELLRINGEHGVIHRGALQLKPTGKYSFGRYADPGDKGVFFGMLATYFWRVRHGVGIDPTA